MLFLAKDTGENFCSWEQRAKEEGRDVEDYKKLPAWAEADFNRLNIKPHTPQGATRESNGIGIEFQSDNIGGSSFIDSDVFQ